MSRDDILIEVAKTIWPFEDEPPLRMGVVEGIVWATARGPVGINGYALIPAEGHPWSRMWPTGKDQPEQAAESREYIVQMYRRAQEVGWQQALTDQYVDLGESDYIDDYVDVHGGVSWYTHPWIGFDTGHLYDVWPEELDPRGLCKRWREQSRDGMRYWTHDMVAEEAQRLASQIANHAEIDRILRETNRKVE